MFLREMIEWDKSFVKLFLLLHEFLETYGMTLKLELILFYPRPFQHLDKTSLYRIQNIKKKQKQ